MRRTKFYKRIPALLISVLFTATFLSIFYAQEIFAEEDIGLRVYDGTESVAIAVEPAGPSTSPLRIAKGGNIYSIVLVAQGDSKESGLRIQTANPGIMGLKKYVPLPTAYVTISMWKSRAFRTWYTVHVTVTVRENTSSGAPMAGVTVQGAWGGAYGGSVSGTTNASGQVSWSTSWIGSGSWVSFTVNSITKGSDVYELGGTLSASIGI